MDGLISRLLPAALISVFLLSLPGAVLADVPGFLPQELTISNSLTGQDKWRIYKPEGLFEYINGGAELYIEGGMHACYARDFTGGTGNNLTVNVYEMKNSLQAFGLFREFFGEENILKGPGSEAVLSTRRLVFWQDRFFTEVIDKSEKQLDSLNLVKISGAVAKTIPGKPGLPAAMSWFDKKLLVPGSGRYIQKNFKSLSGVNRVITCEYAWEKNNPTLFVVLSESKKKSRDMYMKLKEKFPKSDGSKSAPFLKQYKSFDSGNFRAVRYGEYIVGEWGAESSKTSADWLKAIIKKIGARSGKKSKK